MKFYLIVAKGKKQGLPIPIEVDLFVMGSGKECQLRAAHETIGEEHCALVTRGRKVFVRDLNSGNPTVVNGAEMPPSEEWPLHAGDLIEVGPLKFMIQYREKALSQRDLEEWALRCLDDDMSRKKTAMQELEEKLMARTQEAENASILAGAILDRLSAQRGVVRGRLRIARDGEITIVRVNDIYLVEEAEVALIRKELLENLDRQNLRVLLDLKNVKRMSTTGAEMLAELHHWLRARCSRMAICRLRSELVGAMTALPDCGGLKIFNDKPTALAGHW